MQLSDVEVRSAVTRRLAGRRRERARRRLAAQRDEMLIVRLDDLLIEEAGDLAEAHRLRSLDAVHLAAALSLADKTVVLATWDAELKVAARARGLGIAPA